MATSFTQVPILQNLKELVSAGLITEETAEKIREYYQLKSSKSSGSLLVVFSILGALLVGLGIILILAHNWDELSRPVKVTLAFLPMVTAQLGCIFTLIKKSDRVAWREGWATFMFLSVGAYISLCSQIYNIEGDFGSFLLTWCLLCLPVVYIMQSSIASLFYLIGITWYAGATGYGKENLQLYYWPLLFCTLPYYYLLYRKNSSSNFVIVHHWAVALSLTYSLSTIIGSAYEFIIIAYMSLFGFFYIVGNFTLFQSQKLRNNSYLVIGSVGTVIMLLALSFNFIWKEMYRHSFDWHFANTECTASMLITLMAVTVLSFRIYRQGWTKIHLIETVFVWFILLFILGYYDYPAAIILINLLIFIVGVATVVKGINTTRFVVLNYGLIIITGLIVCRFFDTQLSFILRGILFIIVGAGFFVANYSLAKRKKLNG